MRRDSAMFTPKIDQRVDGNRRDIVPFLESNSGILMKWSEREGCTAASPPLAPHQHFASRPSPAGHDLLSSLVLHHHDFNNGARKADSLRRPRPRRKIDTMPDACRSAAEGWSESAAHAISRYVTARKKHVEY
jgi:hypothetical protein